MIRAVRHFLWYLDHHTNRGRGGADRSVRPARLYGVGARTERKASLREPRSRPGSQA